MGLVDLARWIKGNGCKKLVKRTSNEFTISGTSAEIADFKLNIGSFSNKVVELVKATQNAVALDDAQYLLCDEISKMQDGDILKDECKRMRLQIIYGFTQLRGILGSIEQVPTNELKKELAKWIKEMAKLYKQGMLATQPKGRISIGKGKSAIATARIMKYQGLTETEMNKAIKLI